MIERRRIRVEGFVQGVGFRPFVYGLAQRHALGGFIRNDSDGVLIEVEGDSAFVDTFIDGLRREHPPLAGIDTIRVEALEPRYENGFAIERSVRDQQRHALISPDASVCDDCLHEMFDPGDRRFQYPFINCTNCGPRFTIVRDVPYDRVFTTMARFEMCPSCRAEYEDPGDRRFHAQPNACPECGPHLSLLLPDDMELDDDPLQTAVELLTYGAIVAVKGLGGFHLACDATDEEAVAQLRARKHREDKPFALMVRDLNAARGLCHVSENEAVLLTSVKRPIVLLQRRDDADVASSVAPGQPQLGIMLPYTPLHYLLLNALDRPLVMTSGNVSDEPIAYQDDEALTRLGGIADFFLVHDRDIQTRCDDSVVRVVEGRETLVRRSRGYAPAPLAMPGGFVRPILACGAELKNTFCLGKDGRAFVSHHIGDLENYETLRSFESGIDHFQRLFDIRPEVVAHDLHPEYLSTKYALALTGIEHVGVQHHHAHIAAAMAEHGLMGPVIGVAFDGTGYGADVTLWGAEFLVAELSRFERAGHLEYVPLPGGEKAIREPWRVAAAWLRQACGDDFERLDIDFTRRLRERPWMQLHQMLQRGANCPVASSAGRLFDAVSSLCGVRDFANYEGQAAIELEALADADVRDAYDLPVADGAPLVLQASQLIRDVARDLQRGAGAGIVAGRFHNSLARAIADVCCVVRARRGLERVVLGGGVFQNQLLLRRAREQLRAAGFEVFVPAKLPANDGGISFGQAAVANARIAEQSRGMRGEMDVCAWES